MCAPRQRRTPCIRLCRFLRAPLWLHSDHPPFLWCMQDIEITRGYVPGYCQPMGHEFVGRVVECSQQPELVGSRVVGEININCAGFSCADAVFQRNHAPDRCV